MNIQILERLTDYFNRNPDIRFQQGLQNLNIVRRNAKCAFEDCFYEEPSETLDKMNCF